MPKIKRCRTFKGYGTSANGDVYSFWSNKGGKWHIADKPTKKLSPFPECPASAAGRPIPRICLFMRINKVRTKRFVHQIVADAWLKGKKKGDIVLHKDDNTQNNHYRNLCWGTHRVNAHQRKHNQMRDIIVANYRNQIRSLKRKLARYE